jgi:hypothetical protein
MRSDCGECSLLIITKLFRQIGMPEAAGPSGFHLQNRSNRVNLLVFAQGPHPGPERDRPGNDKVRLTSA